MEGVQGSAIPRRDWVDVLNTLGTGDKIHAPQMGTEIFSRM